MNNQNETSPSVPTGSTSNPAGVLGIAPQASANTGTSAGSRTPASAPKNLISFFPLKEARAGQQLVLAEIEKVMPLGKRIIILEAPVGSGKSAIAVALAKAFGSDGAHIITPRKSLQDQYFEDFNKDLVLMKGRNAYPCTYDSPPRHYATVIKAIKEGRIKAPVGDFPSCGDAPCKNSKEVFQMCNNERACPYTEAIAVAQESPAVVHNLHSFIFQSNFGGKFDTRGVLIIDEAHEIENHVRDFITKKLVINKNVEESKYANLKTPKDWATFLLSPEFVPEESDADRAKKTADKTFKSAKDEYLAKVLALEEKDRFEKGMSVNVNKLLRPGQHTPYATSFEFVPHYVGSACKSLLFDYGDFVLLMSGTIYNKEMYCRSLGIRQEEAHFIRIGSSFPASLRPAYLKPEYQVNTSHAQWTESFPKLIQICQKILSIFHDAKGLIHAPSYMAAEQLRNAINDPRIVTHTPQDFLTKLDEFFASKGNQVFISPVCQQGVDFKEDRARFQIVVRVPYPNTSSAFVADKVQNDFQWYNYQTLIVFGQQMGRVNRSESDYGATFLVDSRFNQFLSRNQKILPTWLKQGFIYK